jgi:glycosyltransferase involved in cell wall biosynthesis
MRVLFMLEDLGLGGVERVTVNLIRHLSPKLQATGGAVDLMVAGPNRELLTTLPEAVNRYEVLRKPTRMRQAFPVIRRAIRQLESRYDLIVPTSPHLLAASLISNTRVLPWVHFDYQGMNESQAVGLLTKLAMRACYPWRKHMVFAAPGALLAMPDWFGRDNWKVIPNLFDPDNYPPHGLAAAAIKRINTNGLPLLGFVGRLSKEKGVDRLLAAHRHLLATGLNHHLAVIGDGPERHLLKNAGPNLHVLGADPNPLKALAMFDATLLTSYMDTWPTVAIESLSMGTPVVAYDCPSGPRSILTGNLAPGLAKNGDVDDLTRAVEWALTAAPEAIATQQPQVVTDSAPDAVIRQWLDLFSKVLAA